VLAVRELARFDLIEVAPEAELFDGALADAEPSGASACSLRDGDGVRGILGQLDLLDFIAHHSHIVALQIDAASSIAHLQRGRCASTRRSSCCTRAASGSSASRAWSGSSTRACSRSSGRCSRRPSSSPTAA
jgi:signal-transduction protein with cAMP-binding, CBS, and nucleotidyltransferase domain